MRLALGLSLLAGASLRAVENAELRRYGFSSQLSNSVDQSRSLEIPAPVGSSVVPTAVNPGDLLDPGEIPGAPEFVARVIRQRQDSPTPGREGLVEGYPGEEHARAEEGTFKEVEDFFFHPTQIHRRLLSMNESGQTGLVNMPTAEIPRPGGSFVRLGFGYTLYDRYSGTNLPGSQGIESFTAPFTYQTIPWKNLELSLQVTGINEESNQFPLVNDYSVAGIRDVGVNAKYRFFDNPQTQVQAAFGFGMNVGVERLTTRLGSNAVDYNLYLVGTKRVKNFGVHLRGGLTFPNGENRTNSGVPDISRVDLGLDFSPSDKLSVMAELNYVDWNFVGTNTEVALGFKYRMSDTWVFDVGIPIQLDNNLVEGYRYRALASIQAQL
jgi:hypothetical protein